MKDKSKPLSSIIPCILTVFLLLTCNNVFAASNKQITLTYASPYNLNHPRSIADQDWIKKIEKETNGQVKIKYFPGGSLIGGRNTWPELLSGVADIAYVWGATADGFDITKKTYSFYYGISSQETRLKIYEETCSKFPEIMAEYNKVKVLQNVSGADYQLMSRKPVRTIEDFKGLSLKATGAWVSVLKNLGGQGISMPVSEVYVSTEKGIIDGCLMPYEALKSFMLAEVLKYVTNVWFCSSPYPQAAINLDSWNKLPVNVQKVFNDNINWYGLRSDTELSKKDTEAIDMAKKLGVEFIDLTAEQLNELYKSVEAVSLEEAGKLDAMGFPGTDIYKEVRRLAKKYAQ